MRQDASEIVSRLAASGCSGPRTRRWVSSVSRANFSASSYRPSFSKVSDQFVGRHQCVWMLRSEHATHRLERLALQILRFGVMAFPHSE